MRGSTSRARPAPADATGPSAGADSTTSAPRRTAPLHAVGELGVGGRPRCARPPRRAGRSSAGAASSDHDRDRRRRAQQRGSAARPPAPDAPGRRSSTSARGRLPASSPTPASAAPCAAERTCAPAVAAERSTPPVSSAASARGSAEQGVVEHGHRPARAGRRPAAGSPRPAAAPGCRRRTGKPRPHAVQVSTSASGSVGVPARSGAWSSDGQARISISWGSSSTATRSSSFVRCGPCADRDAARHVARSDLPSAGRRAPHRGIRPIGLRRGRSPGPRRAARPCRVVGGLDVQPQQRLGVATGAG